jgi:hypothetical protein
MLGFVTNLSMSLSSIHIEFTIEFLGFLVYVFGLKSGPALLLGDLGGRLKPPKGRRPHNKIYIKKKSSKKMKKKANFIIIFFFAMRRGRGKKKRHNYNTQTILSKKKSKNKSALFLHEKYQ